MKTSSGIKLLLGFFSTNLQKAKGCHWGEEKQSLCPVLTHLKPVFQQCRTPQYSGDWFCRRPHIFSSYRWIIPTKSLVFRSINGNPEAEKWMNGSGAEMPIEQFGLWNWIDTAPDCGNGGGHGGGGGDELASIAGSFRILPLTHLQASVVLSKTDVVLDISQQNMGKIERNRENMAKAAKQSLWYKR